MMRNVTAIAILLVFLFERTAAFAPTSAPSSRLSGWTTLRESSNSAEAPTEPVLTEPEQRVYGLLEEIHDSKLSFRVVVVGNGAILESTATLGPTMKLSQSPATGVNMVTFASEDSSFEFHLQTAQVSKIALVEKKGPTGRTMRIMRFVNTVGKPICSLILSEDSESVAEWYGSIISKYGEEMQL
jgi:putative heme iron utilization protein